MFQVEINAKRDADTYENQLVACGVTRVEAHATAVKVMNQTIKEANARIAAEVGLD